MRCILYHIWPINPTADPSGPAFGFWKPVYRTVISSSHLVVGRAESFCRFMCHDLAPRPWAAENTLPLP